jgi:cell division septum initiation protein DivIVA
VWEKLVTVIREVFDLRQQVKGLGKRLEELTGHAHQLSEDDRWLNERVLRLELELQHTKETHARDFTQLKEAHAHELAHLKGEYAREREHWEQRQLADRQSFRLQIENLILRMQRGLPPPELLDKSDDE